MKTKTQMPTMPKFTFRGRPLTKEESKLYIGLIFSKSSKGEESIDKSSIKDEFAAKILIKRIQVYKLPFNISDMFFVMSVETFAKNPGKLMILLRLCYQYHQKTQQTFLGIDEWTQLFVPTDQELKQMWGSQKHPDYDNLLDNPFYWKNQSTQ